MTGFIPGLDSREPALSLSKGGCLYMVCGSLQTHVKSETGLVTLDQMATALLAAEHPADWTKAVSGPDTAARAP